MWKKLITLFVFVGILSASGGYDHGTSAGKNNWDISLTWNPFNFFHQGQSYIVLGYGFTDRLDIHGYFSKRNDSSNNYYGGVFYQFYRSKNLDLSTAVGIRKYTDKTTQHLFFPQLLYTVHLNQKMRIGGSFVDIKSYNLKDRKGLAFDMFLMFNLFEDKKYKVDLTFGAFNPVLWEPQSGDWHATYSIDIKIKK